MANNTFLSRLLSLFAQSRTSWVTTPLLPRAEADQGPDPRHSPTVPPATTTVPAAAPQMQVVPTVIAAVAAKAVVAIMPLLKSPATTKARTLSLRKPSRCLCSKRKLNRISRSNRENKFRNLPVKERPLAAHKRRNLVSPCRRYAFN